MNSHEGKHVSNLVDYKKLQHVMHYRYSLVQVDVGDQSFRNKEWHSKLNYFNATVLKRVLGSSPLANLGWV